ncbi:MAG: TerC family protein [Planctomycetes bacterium]|nr:TerC family protein [Planctomycetota bacterium]
MPDHGNALLWALFLLFIGLMLALDLGVFHREARVPTFREALTWTTVWAALAAAFGGWIGWAFGAVPCVEFFTGYVIELSLSADNVFVFVVIFGSLHIPRQFQHRVLFWGVLTALVLRGVMIVGGAALIARWHGILYGFGGFLLLTGLKMLRQPAHGVSAEDSWLLGFLRRHLHVTGLHGPRFWVRVDGRLRATPLLMALLMVEVSDVVFAVDSIPAIFAVTRDPFLVFTANVFAILGLRSLFFVLAGLVDKFRYLKVGLAIVLAFVGAKLLLLDVVQIPALASLAVVLGVLGAAVLVSLRRGAAT